MVLVGCRHPRAVPLAFRVSAQFDGLAHMSVPTCPASPPCTDGLRVRVDPGWSACPPTRPSGHTLGISMRTANGDSRGDTRHPLPETFTQLKPTHPVKRPLVVSNDVVSSHPTDLRVQQTIKSRCACTQAPQRGQEWSQVVSSFPPRPVVLVTSSSPRSRPPSASPVAWSTVGAPSVLPGSLLLSMFRSLGVELTFPSGRC
jgi:hypothetical protein